LVKHGRKLRAYNRIVFGDRVGFGEIRDHPLAKSSTEKIQPDHETISRKLARSLLSQQKGVEPNQSIAHQSA
jgi:hypothetical protein